MTMYCQTIINLSWQATFLLALLIAVTGAITIAAMMGVKGK
jgi:NhaP-type Na+/H+ or K+/H+ antiporter